MLMLCAGEQAVKDKGSFTWIPDYRVPHTFSCKLCDVWAPNSFAPGLKDSPGYVCALNRLIVRSSSTPS